jgi:hypothetical protein
LSTHDAWLFADGTNISQPVPANGVRRFSWTRIAGLRVQSRCRNRSGAALKPANPVLTVFDALGQSRLKPKIAHPYVSTPAFPSATPDLCQLQP